MFKWWQPIGYDGITVELFQILKDDAVKVLHTIRQQFWKTQQWLQDWKRPVFIRIPKKDNSKECSNYHTIALISHTSKVMLKILQARFQQHMNRELPYVQAGLEKAEEPEIKLPKSIGSLRKQESSIKTSTSALLTMQSLWLCGSQQTGHLFKQTNPSLQEMEYQTTWPASWEICMQVKKQ